MHMQTYGISSGEVWILRLLRAICRSVLCQPERILNYLLHPEESYYTDFCEKGMSLQAIYHLEGTAEQMAKRNAKLTFCEGNKINTNRCIKHASKQHRLVSFYKLKVRDRVFVCLILKHLLL